MKPNNVTAKNFTDPVLRALADLTDYQVDKNIGSKELNTRVCGLLDLTEDEWGIYKRSRLWTHELIGQALATLKRNEMAHNPTRGHWSLTDNGLETARTMRDTLFAKPGVESAAAMTTAAAAIMEDDENATAETLVIVTNSEAASDDYLRKVMEESAECFGHYDAADKACKGCAVQGSCQATMLIKLSELAKHIRTEDARRQEVLAEPADPVAGIDKKIEKMVAVPKKNAKRIKSWMDACCTKCGVDIKKGEWSMWAVGVGMWHEACDEGSA